MRSQLAHLAKVSSLRHVTVQVLPFAAGAHPAMTAPFTQLGFAEPWESMNAIYLENGRGALYLEGAADLERYAWMFDQLTQLAFSPKKSRDLLITVARDLWGTEWKGYGMINPDLVSGARWRKSSRSGGEGTECVELANIGAVRDSKNPTDQALRVDLAGLLDVVKRGRFDLD